VEAEWSGMHEVQLKFKGTISEETLRKLGAERLSSTVQIDNYYNPRDRNLIKTGEILRIREEGDRRILTYKGLKIEGKFRERPKFEFEIDEKTEKAFLGIYGDKVKIIQKQRTLYQLDGVIFSLDKVFKIEGGRKVKLGNFIEIRATDKTVEPDKIKAVIKKLGFSEAEGIKKSYFEM
jgi:predicted adenylyl cyclase CyaB